MQIFGSGFSLGSNQVCFYQSSTALIYCTGYNVSQVTYISDGEVDVAVSPQVTSAPGSYNVQVQQQYYVNQTCSYYYCYSCGWSGTCCSTNYYNCSYYTTFSTGLRGTHSQQDSDDPDWAILSGGSKFWRHH